MEELSDLELVESYRQGDHQAFGVIVKRHHPRLTWVARRYARREEDVQDILQEAYLRAALKLHTFRAESKLTTWLYRLVANAAVDYSGRARNRKELVVLDDDTRHGPSGGLTHDPMHGIDLRLSLEPLVKTLNPNQAAAMILVYAMGCSVEQTAELLGVRPGTVKSRSARGRSQLKKLVEPELRQDCSTTARPGQLVG